MEMQKLDRIIKEIWAGALQDDFKNSRILNEDTLKCVLYYRLRTAFEKDPDFNDFIIFIQASGQGVSAKEYHPDMIIMQKNKAEESDYETIYVKDCLAVFEMKYQSSKDFDMESQNYRNFEKIKEYQELFGNCQFYNCDIVFGDFNYAGWLDKCSTGQWKNGCVTELIVYESNGDLKFGIYSYNGMNKDLQ